MTGNSLQSLLERMASGPATQRWGGVLALSRSRLNRMLEKQYIDRFDGYSFLPLISGRISSSTGSYQFVELKSIGLGQPLISFTDPSLENPKAVVSMNIIAGHYATFHQPPSGLSTQLSQVSITEQQGLKLEVDVDLKFLFGEIDGRGKVRFNLAEALAFRCNIAGSDDALNNHIAEFFKEEFKTLPEHRSGFRLGEVELKGYNTLTPASFRIVTQPAPGATVNGALNYGDGLVALLIRLQGNSGEGRWPLGSDFPFFIPDDRAPDGSAKYSAAFILSEEMLANLKDNPQDPINNLYFPGEHAFVETERHQPRDLGVFGNLSPLETSTSLVPAFKTLKAGDSVQFTMHDWKGQPVQASNWKAVSLQSHSLEGHGKITSSGLYTAAAKAQIGHESLHVVVSAEYQKEGITYNASALLLVVFEASTLAPQVATYALQTQTQSIVLSASTADESPVSLSLLPPVYGALVQNGNQGVFTPNALVKARGLVVQQVEAAGTEKRQSSLVLINAKQDLKLDPPFVPVLKSGANVQFKEDTSLLPGFTRRWRVIGGSGTVDANGLFTAASGATSSSIVRCEIVRNGIVLKSGYSVVNLSDLEPDPTWKTLAQFTLKVPGGLDNGRMGSLYRNGYQQLETEVVVETEPVDKETYPLSITERASMRLAHASKDEVEFVDDALDGMPPGDTERWRARLNPNRFNQAMPRTTGQDDSSSADPGITRQSIYLHSRAAANSTSTFHAVFQKDDTREWFRSTEKGETYGKVDVTALGLPEVDTEDYRFTRERVAGGTGGSWNGDPWDPEHPDFDYRLQTIDYLTFAFIGRPGGEKGASFEVLEFLPVKGNLTNISSVRWESAQSAEVMVSWIGWIFRDRLKTDDTQKIKFDEVIKDVIKNEDLDITVNHSFFEVGKLVLTLHRSDRVPYIWPGAPARDKLSRDLAVRLIDKNGNEHLRQFSFLPENNVGHRNKLVHQKFTPPE